MSGASIRLRINPSLIPTNAAASIGSVATLAPGSNATVVNVGTPQNPILDFGIPRGSPGIISSIVQGSGLIVNNGDPANPAVGLDAAATVRNYLSAPPYVATRTVLKTLDTTKETVAHLAESGREGLFLFYSGNYASFVTADPSEGGYVKANAVAASLGAWVRVTANGYYPEWFGGTNSAAIKAAYALAVLNAKGLVSLKPNTVYSFDGSDPILHTSGSCYIRGAGPGPSIVTFTENAAVTFIVYSGGRDYGIENVKFVGPSSTIPTSGAVVQVTNTATSDAFFSKIVMRGGKFYDCFDFFKANQITIDSIVLYEAQHRHIAVRSTVNVLVSNFFINGVSKTGDGVYVLASATDGDCEALQMVNGIIPNCSHSLITVGAALTQGGGRSLGCHFDDVWFDDAANEGVSLDYAVDYTFKGVHCVSASGLAGFWAKNTYGVKVFASKANKNEQKGFRFDKESSEFDLIGCSALDNDDLSAGGKIGIWIESGALHFRIIGCKAHANTPEFNKLQAYGLQIGLLCDDFVVTDNDFSGNNTTNVVNSAGYNRTTKIFRDNIGWTVANGGSASVTPDANGEFTIAHGCNEVPLVSSFDLVGDFTKTITVRSAPDATNVTGRIWNPSTGADITLGSHTIYWSASAA